MAIGSRAGILAGQAYVSLGLFSGDFDKGLLGAQQKLNNLGGKLMNTFGKATLAIGTASTGFGLFFKKINDDTIQLYRMSKAMGVSIEFLSSLRYEATQFNVKMEDIDSGLTQFRRRILQASLGTKEAIQTLSTLGVTWEEFAKLAPEKQILKLGEALSALPEGMRKSAGVQVFGDVGRKVFPIFESFAKDMNKAKRDGVTVTKSQVESALILQKVFTNLTASLNSFVRDVMTTVGPTLLSLMKIFVNVSKEVREFALAHPDFTKNILLGAAAFALFTASMWSLGAILKAVSFGLGGLRSIFVDLPKLILAAVSPIRMFNAAFAVTSGIASTFKSLYKGISDPIENYIKSKSKGLSLFVQPGGAKGLASQMVTGMNMSVVKMIVDLMKLLGPIMPLLGGGGSILGAIGAIIGPIISIVAPIMLIVGGISLIFGALKHIKTIFGSIIDGVKTFGESLNRISNGSLKRTWELLGDIRDVILAIISGKKWDLAWEALKISGTYAFLTLRDLAFATFNYIGSLVTGTILNKELWSKGFAVIWNLMVEGFFSALDSIREGLALVLGPTLAKVLGLSTKKTMTPGEIREKMQIEEINPFTGEYFRNTRAGGHFGRKIHDLREMFGADLEMSEAEKSGTETLNRILKAARKRGLTEQAISKMQIPVDTEAAEAMANRFETVELSMKDFTQSISEMNNEIVKNRSLKNKIQEDTLQAKIEFDDLHRFLTDVPKQAMEEGFSPSSTMPALKQAFETFGTFSGFRLGAMGVGSSVQEKIASGIEKLVEGQDETNSLLSNMDAPAFGG
jgi:hypothetical protein